MNEEQQQNYRNLFINRLLTCANSEEAQILNANPELIDAEFMEAIDHFIYKGSRLIQEFPKDSKIISQEMTIKWYKIAAKIFIRYELLEGWAKIQNNLGSVYCNRIYGYRPENLEEAITAYKDALQIRTPEVLPEEWADTQNNLGNAYWYLGQIDEAIAAFKAALQIYTREAFSEKWAAILNNLGIAYCETGEIDEAINVLLSALHVYISDASRTERAESQNNLGIAYRKRGLISEAITVLQDALRFYTHADFPEYWAITTSSLGEAFRDGGQIEQAINCFRSALKEVFTPQNFPVHCLESGRHLGNMTFSLQRWNEAIDGYGVAVEAVEQSREWAGSDSRKAEILSAAIDVYAKMVQACINIGQPDKAIEYVERSKARNLVELLANKDLYPERELYLNPDTYQTHCDRLNQLRREIPAKQRQLEILTSSPESERRNRSDVEQLRQELNHLQQQRDELLGEINQVDSSFTLIQKVEPIPFSDIQALTDENTVIVEWYITDSQILTFIITHQNPHPIIVFSSAEEMKALEDWEKEYRVAYRQQKSQWITNLASRLQRLAEILHIDDILSRIDDIFEQKGARCDRLILIPHRYLHLFPLHALPVASGNLLLDRFPNGVGYAPSCQLLKLAKDQEQQRTDFSHLFAIQNPTRSRSKPLLGSQLEVDRIRQHFDPNHSIVLAEAEATEAKVNQRMTQLPSAHCVHFSCHGVFKPESPLESALLLADPEDKLGADANLTLGKIFEKLYLNQCRLVTFSACESGMTDPTSISDEYIGLPSGFLYAGSLSIVSTLWTVDPLATTLLMVKFYKNLKHLPELKAGDVALALKKAQAWLRTLTSKKLAIIQNNRKFQRWIEQVFDKLPKRDRNKFSDLLYAALKRQPYPFTNPYYWSCFVATGL
jgi:CHAT domain-containing protein/Tfp pilus assembly protein PilF